MPLSPGNSRDVISNNIKEMQAAGHSHAQAVAASLSNAQRHPHMAVGGQPPEAPWFVRREAGEMYHPSGFLHSTGAGRSDTLPRTVAAESHVLPSDVVAGLGEGNSLAGAAIMDKILSTGPFGTRLPHRADGGAVQKVPVQLSGGEYTLSPEQVRAWGGGDLAKGHAAIDRFILAVRKHTISKMRKLPKPKR